MRPSGQEGKRSVTSNKGRGRQNGPDPQQGSPRESVWQPFKRLMAITCGLAVVAVTGALAWLRATGAPPRWELYLAVSVGVAGTLLLTGALMGLVFVSSRSGHDESIDRREADD
jgi:hypothetical protein